MKQINKSINPINTANTTAITVEVPIITGPIAAKMKIREIRTKVIKCPPSISTRSALRAKKYLSNIPYVLKS